MHAERTLVSLRCSARLLLMSANFLERHGGIVQQVRVIALHPLAGLFKTRRGIATKHAQDLVSHHDYTG